MKRCALLLLLCACAHGAPADTKAPGKPGSCTDPSSLGAAKLALEEINKGRQEGYIFGLIRLSNVNLREGHSGTVFYLTIDVAETDCHVLSRKDYESCPVRPLHGTPVYGQCKATIYINKVKRIVHLYKYNCKVRPAPGIKIVTQCPDCPSLTALDDAHILMTVKTTLEKFNKESGTAHYFTLLNVSRASRQSGMGEFYHADYTIQETTCSNTTDVAELSKCPLMQCEFQHKGLCRGSFSSVQNKNHTSVKCELFEPEAADKEKERHLLGGETDHSHKHEHGKGSNHTHDHDHAHGHDHTHDHGHGHDHTHDHGHGHDHTHDHGHDHNHTHDHHKAHNHSRGGFRPHWHGGKHGHSHGHGRNHTHGHNHTHDHGHLHEHEHHHGHGHERRPWGHRTGGVVEVLPPLGSAVTLPALIDPKGAVTLPLSPDADPEEKELVILPSPGEVSPQCPGEAKSENAFINELFAEDPLFKVTVA